MDEALDLHFAAAVRRLLHRPAALRHHARLLERKLAGEHGAAEAELLQRQHALEVVGHELGGGVELQLREVAAAGAGEAEVLHDRRVGAELGEARGGLERGAHAQLVHHRVERHVDATAAAEGAVAGAGEEVGELGEREVLGEGAGGELGEPAVDGVGAGREGGERGLEVAGGGEQLDAAHPCLPVYASVENGGVSVRPSRQSRTALSRAFIDASRPRPDGV